MRILICIGQDVSKTILVIDPKLKLLKDFVKCSGKESCIFK